jgi:dihydroorotate dehydrogenase electron transfer subunit
VRQFAFDVASNERVGDGIFRMVMHAPGLAPTLSPGQFVNVAVPGDPSHITRIPLSFAGTDPQAQTIEIVYAVVGEGTSRLSRMGEGDASTVLGPCGRGWRLPGGEDRALLVAGGIGLPPVLAAAEMLAAAGRTFDAVVGAQRGSKLVGVDVDLLREAASADPSSRVVVCTDDGSLGRAGFTTDAMAELLAERSYDAVLTCGPTVMMAGVARLAEGAGIACQASLERMMGCGFGACSCCNVAMRDGTSRSCCMDGPVFNAGEVAW